MISTGITFASENYLITQGSLILQTVAVLGTAGSQAENKIFINQINLQVIFCQNSDASKLCSVVASNESFVSFLYINELYRKMAVFLETGDAFFYRYVLEMFWLSWKTTQNAMSDRIYPSSVKRFILKVIWAYFRSLFLRLPEQHYF